MPPTSFEILAHLAVLEQTIRLELIRNPRLQRNKKILLLKEHIREMSRRLEPLDDPTYPVQEVIKDLKELKNLYENSIGKGSH